jgi:SAM-dependent methyltransferase
LGRRFDAVVGVDVSPEMVERARRLVPEPGITFEVGSGTDLGSLPDGRADLVVTYTVFQHLPSVELVEGYLVEAARVLRPGGVLAAHWNNSPHARLWRWRTRWWELRRAVGIGAGLDVRTDRRFSGVRLSLAAMTAMTARAGLQVRATRHTGSLYAVLWAQKG